MAHYARWINFLGGDVRQVGWILGLGSIAGLLFRPWLGQWINRLGARTTWALGYFFFGMGVLGNLFLHHLSWEIYLLRSCLVLGVAFVFSSSLTYVTQTAPVEKRTEAIGILGAGGFVGMLIGPYLGGIILGAGDRSRSDFLLLFLVAFVAVMVPLILLAFLRIPVGGRRSAPVRLKDFFQTARRYWPGTILLVNATFGACMTVPFAFLADFIDQTGLSVPGMSEVGLFFLGYAGWGLAVRLGLRRLPDRVGRRRVLLAGLLFMGAGMFFFLLVTPSRGWLLILPGLVCGTGHALAFPTMVSLALDPFPSEVRGTGSALTLMMIDLGLIGGAPIVGLIAGLFGYPWLFTILGLSCFAVAGIYARRCRRRTPDPPVDQASLLFPEAKP